MNKKGITLVELLAVLALIALVATILIPNINKHIIGSKNKARTIQESTIIESAKAYVMDHINEDINFDTNNSVTIKLFDLVDGGYLTDEPKEAKTGKEYNLESSTIVVTKINNEYEYKLNLNTK